MQWKENTTPGMKRIGSISSREHLDRIVGSCFLRSYSLRPQLYAFAFEERNYNLSVEEDTENGLNAVFLCAFAFEEWNNNLSMEEDTKNGLNAVFVYAFAIEIGAII